jgi:hypothetical protein
MAREDSGEEGAALIEEQGEADGSKGKMRGNFFYL